LSVAAVICEYNPFHRGHAYQLQEIRRMLGEDTVILSLMSGSTVQRGEAAVASKYNRAAAAVSCGADLVLELPYPYCSSVAEQFALSAVSILSSLGVVDYLVFGSESGDLSMLCRHAKQRASTELIELLSKKRGERSELSYPRLVDECYNQLYGLPFPKDPNDILGVFYLMALEKQNSALKPLCHRRLDGASATLGRKKMKMGDLSEIPEGAKKFFSQSSASLETGELAVLHFLRNHSDRRIANAALQATSLTQLYDGLSQKNLTDARVRRDVLHALLGYSEIEFELPKFTTVLGMNEKGAALLRSIKKCSEITLITKPADYKQYPAIRQQFERNLRSDALFSVCSERMMPANWSLKESPFVKK